MSIKYYVIESFVHGFALDAGSDSVTPGTLVKANTSNGSKGQLWRDDPDTNTIRSKLNDNYCFDFNQAGKLVINPYIQDKNDQHWKRIGAKIFNKPENLVLQLDGNQSGSTVIKAPEDPNEIPSQSWTYTFP